MAELQQLINGLTKLLQQYQTKRKGKGKGKAVVKGESGNGYAKFSCYVGKDLKKRCSTMSAADIGKETGRLWHKLTKKQQNMWHNYIPDTCDQVVEADPALVSLAQQDVQQAVSVQPPLPLLQPAQGQVVPLQRRPRATTTTKPSSSRKGKLSGYNLFQQRMWPEISARNPGMTFAETSRSVGAIWRSLDEETKGYWNALSNSSLSSATVGQLKQEPEAKRQQRRARKRTAKTVNTVPQQVNQFQQFVPAPPPGLPPSSLILPPTVPPSVSPSVSQVTTPQVTTPQITTPQATSTRYRVQVKQEGDSSQVSVNIQAMNDRVMQEIMKLRKQDLPNREQIDRFFAHVVDAGRVNFWGIIARNGVVNRLWGRMYVTVDVETNEMIVEWPATLQLSEGNVDTQQELMQEIDAKIKKGYVEFVPQP
jgi:hypothetical protein